MLLFLLRYRSLFSAGHPNKVDCTSGAARHFSLALWALYGLVSGVVLMNLLIALVKSLFIAKKITGMYHISFFKKK